MKAISKEQVEFDSAVKFISKTMLENALRMLDNYQPPAPEFEAGDIVERIDKGLLEHKQFLVIGKGPTKRALVREYQDVTTNGDALVVTDGYAVWTDQSLHNYKKVGSL